MRAAKRSVPRRAGRHAIREPPRGVRGQRRAAEARRAPGAIDVAVHGDHGAGGHAAERAADVQPAAVGDRPALAVERDREARATARGAARRRVRGRDRDGPEATVFSPVASLSSTRTVCARPRACGVEVQRAARVQLARHRRRVRRRAAQLLRHRGLPSTSSIACWSPSRCRSPRTRCCAARRAGRRRTASPTAAREGRVGVVLEQIAERNIRYGDHLGAPVAGTGPRCRRSRRSSVSSRTLSRGRSGHAGSRSPSGGLEPRAEHGTPGRRCRASDVAAVALDVAAERHRVRRPVLPDAGTGPGATPIARRSWCPPAPRRCQAASLSAGRAARP